MADETISYYEWEGGDSCGTAFDVEEIFDLFRRAAAEGWSARRVFESLKFPDGKRYLEATDSYEIAEWIAPGGRGLIDQLRGARCLDPEAPAGERSVLLNMAADAIEYLEQKLREVEAECERDAAVLEALTTEVIERELREYQRIAEGPPGDFDKHEQAKAWGAIEHCNKQLAALKTRDRPERCWIVRCTNCDEFGGPFEGHCGNCGEPVDPLRDRQEWIAMPAALQHAQEQVGEERG